jgi:hypothetical protein
MAASPLANTIDRVQSTAALPQTAQRPARLLCSATQSALPFTAFPRMVYKRADQDDIQGEQDLKNYL